MISRAIAVGVMMMGSVVYAQPRQPGPPPRPSIIVGGSGEVDVSPDQAVVRLGAVAQDKDAGDAQQEVNKIMQRAINRISSLDVKKKNIHTTRISLRPIYKSDEHETQRKIVGYEASNVVEVTLDDLSKIGPVIDVGVASGADDIEGVDFQLADQTPAMQEALKRAAQDARAKAQAIADAMDVKLGPVEEVQEAGVQRVMPMPYAGRMMMAKAVPATPVSPGQIKISDQVTVRYNISQ